MMKALVYQGPGKKSLEDRSGGKTRSKLLITHRFKLDDILDAYDTFGRAASTEALKVIIEAS